MKCFTIHFTGFSFLSHTHTHTQVVAFIIRFVCFDVDCGFTLSKRNCDKLLAYTIVHNDVLICLFN